MDLSVDAIEYHPINANIYGGDENLDDLCDSIRRVGLLSPLVVNSQYLCISGHRRLAACRKLGLKTVEVVIKDVPKTEEESSISIF